MCHLHKIGCSNHLKFVEVFAQVGVEFYKSFVVLVYGYFGLGLFFNLNKDVRQFVDVNSIEDRLDDRNFLRIFRTIFFFDFREILIRLLNEEQLASWRCRCIHCRGA